MRKERLPPSFPPHPKWKIRRYGTQRPFNDTKPDDVFDFDNQSASPIVPYTIAEFCYIQDHFAHDDLETLQTIYDILLMWESRMDGPTLLIDITKMIVQGLLFDKKHVDRATGDEEIDSQQDLSLLFGIVITRFVNYVESIQRRSRFNAPGANPMENFCAQKSTMLNAAMELGLPGDVVEVRHAIVHRAMPKLDVLRATIQTCRQWLWDVHWNMPIEIALNVIETKEPSSVEKPQIQKIKPREFMAAFWDYAAMKQRKRELSELEYAELRRKICKIRLLMSDDPIKAAIALSSAFLLNNDRLIELGEQQPKVEEKHDVWKIPYKWRLFWDEMILLIEELGAFGGLVEYMSKQSWSRLNWWARLQYASWVKYCLKRAKLTGYQLPEWCVEKIVQNMIKAGVYYTWEEIYELITSSKDIDIDVKNLRLKWEAASQRDSDELQVITLDDEPTINIPSASSVDEGNWTLVSIPRPLGLADGQTTKTLNLCVNRPSMQMLNVTEEVVLSDDASDKSY